MLKPYHYCRAAYAALGGLAVLKGQQAQRKKLSDIEEELKRAKTEAGRYFVKFYYAVGPKLALLPRSSKLTKRVLRHILDRF